MGELDQESSDNDQRDSHTIAKRKKLSQIENILVFVEV